jgi:hypothetical protein
VGFSVAAVGAIVKELDEDNSGTIGLYEFADLLDKYYPKELLAATPADKKTSNSSGLTWLFGVHHSHRHGGHEASDWSNSSLYHH